MCPQPPWPRVSDDRPVTANSAIQARLEPLADVLVVAAAVSLPWSTSATAIFAVLWLLALIPTLHWVDIRRELATPSGGLPVLLFTLGLVGMLWADVTLLERWKGLDSFFKLLAIPLLFIQFRRSGSRSLGICRLSFLVHRVAGRYDHCHGDAVDGAFSAAFRQRVGEKRRDPKRRVCYLYLRSVVFGQRCGGGTTLAAGCSVLRRLFSRCLPIFSMCRPAGRPWLSPRVLLIFRIKRLNIKAIVLVISASHRDSASPGGARQRTCVRGPKTFVQIYKGTRRRRRVTSSGERLEFWTKSVDFLRRSPVVGHGTGSIHSLFEKAAVGSKWHRGRASANPHNQTLPLAYSLVSWSCRTVGDVDRSFTFVPRQ